MKSEKFLKAFLLLILVFILTPFCLRGEGHFEFGFHYGTWNIELLESLIEKGLSTVLEEGLKDRILKTVQDTGRDIEEVFYSQRIRFDSGGSNWGLEVRWYPGGFGRSFSLGLSAEKTTMRISVPEFDASLTVRDHGSGKLGSFTGDAGGSQFIIKPLSFHLNFRWDIGPSWPVRPFITFGLGLAGAKSIDEARLAAAFSGELRIEGEEPESYQDSIDKTVKELEEEMEGENQEFFMPPFLPFIQLNFGIKAEITPNLYLLVETGIFNGFVVRGGISVRL